MRVTGYSRRSWCATSHHLDSSLMLAIALIDSAVHSGSVPPASHPILILHPGIHTCLCLTDFCKTVGVQSASTETTWKGSRVNTLVPTLNQRSVGAGSLAFCILNRWFWAVFGMFLRGPSGVEAPLSETLITLLYRAFLFPASLSHSFIHVLFCFGDGGAPPR